MTSMQLKHHGRQTRSVLKISRDHDHHVLWADPFFTARLSRQDCLDLLQWAESDDRDVKPFIHDQLILSDHSSGYSILQLLSVDRTQSIWLILLTQHLDQLLGAIR